VAGPGGTEIGRVSLRVVPDTSKVSDEIRAFVQRIEKSITINIPTSLDFTGFKDDLRKLEVEAKLASPEIKVKTNVDKSAIGQAEAIAGKFDFLKKAVNGVGDAVDGIGSSFLNAGKSLGPLVSQVPVLPAALLAAAPLAADLAVSLGPGLLAAVPAVLGAGAALGVAALSMDKLKTAFKPIIDGFKGMQDAIGSALTRGVQPLVQQFADDQGGPHRCRAGDEWVPEGLPDLGGVGPDGQADRAGVRRARRIHEAPRWRGDGGR
jgi:hypothetical protein